MLFGSVTLRNWGSCVEVVTLAGVVGLKYDRMVGRVGLVAAVRCTVICIVAIVVASSWTR